MTITFDPSTMTTAEAIIVPCVFAVCLVAGILFIRFSNRVKQDVQEGKLIKTSGTIIDLNYDDDVAFPIIEFVANDGRKYRHVSKTGTNPYPKIGKQKDVYYDPSDPTKSRTSAGGPFTIAGIIFILTGAVILIRFLMAHLVIGG